MTLIIAEAGVNHNGSLDLAFELVEAAAQSGADIVKFQSFRAENLVTSTAPKALYQKESTGHTESQFHMLKNLELEIDHHYKLIEHCNKYNIEFLSTAFDSAGIDFLSSLELFRWKIPSGEVTNIPYLRQIARNPKPIILSTGMCNISEVESAVNVLEYGGIERNHITILHCTTDYPASCCDVNLRAMNSLSTALGVSVGYSDHTLGIAVPIASVALGATVVEKHLTLDCSMHGPDHKASLEPSEFQSMVSSIRDIEKALGDGIKRPTEAEMINIPIVRKSIVAAKRIFNGDLFTNENLTAKRPGTGLSPLRWDDIIGRRSTRDYSIDEMIEL